MKPREDGVMASNPLLLACRVVVAAAAAASLGLYIA